VACIAAAIIVAKCGPAPQPVVIPQGDDRYLVDPRLGYEQPVDPKLDRKFSEIWQLIVAGNFAEAHRRLDPIRLKNPDYVPAKLAAAAIDIREGRLIDAKNLISGIDTTAARVYEAEIALRLNETRRAYDLYRALPPSVPGASERVAQLEAAVFNELYTSAQTAPEADAVRLLREALGIRPGSIEARVLLVQKLVAGKEWAEARRAVDPLLANEGNRVEVQEALAEIDAGRGKYEEAFQRYRTLERRTHDPRHKQRLEEIEELWSAANMPPQVTRALQSEAITRADFAVLLYWKVTSVRFAQNLRVPPIATDLGEVAGREEIIRALAIGLYDVDPVTRTVSPSRAVNAERFSRLIARLLTLRGAPCSRGVAGEVFAACKVEMPAKAPEAPVSGQEAARVLAQVDKAL
ncbi:MAG TPA: tetratricopeptide repeat protein, partial [Thermoanaerobaculia bacterium]|nr:tetratricopeptide repeat protein [Thermoanaerobaculia bacterium]